MATITLRPTSASGTSWSNIANAYDGSTSTSATVATISSNYSSRAGTFNFDTSVIPSGATINSATLTVNCKSSNSSRHTLYADINGNSSSRVISVTLNTTQSNRTANVSSYMSNLSSVKLTIANSRTTSYTFTLYEIYITVDYTENSSSGGGNSGEEGTSVKNIKLGTSTIDKLYLGTTQILKAYLGNILLYSYSNGGSGGGGDTPEFSGVLSLVQFKTSDDNGNIIDSTNDFHFMTVDMLPVIGGHSYTITIDTSSAIGVDEFDSAGNYIQYVSIFQGSNAVQTVTYTASSNCSQIRVLTYSVPTPTGTMTPQN